MLLLLKMRLIKIWLSLGNDPSQRLKLEIARMRWIRGRWTGQRSTSAGIKVEVSVSSAHLSQASDPLKRFHRHLRRIDTSVYTNHPADAKVYTCIDKVLS